MTTTVLALVLLSNLLFAAFVYLMMRKEPGQQLAETAARLARDRERRARQTSEATVEATEENAAQALSDAHSRASHESTASGDLDSNLRELGAGD